MKPRNQISDYWITRHANLL